MNLQTLPSFCLSACESVGEGFLLLEVFWFPPVFWVLLKLDLAANRWTVCEHKLWYVQSQNHPTIRLLLASLKSLHRLGILARILNKNPEKTACCFQKQVGRLSDGHYLKKTPKEVGFTHYFPFLSCNIYQVTQVTHLGIVSSEPSPLLWNICLSGK